MKARILGKMWTIAFAKLRRNRARGMCDPVEAKDKTIVIEERLRGRAKLDTVIHEATHAAFPWMAEETVQEFAADLARLCYRLGFLERTEEAGDRTTA